MTEEYQKQFDLGYNAQVKYLQEKYGPVPGNYFLTESCKATNSKIKRIKEGLYIHHVAEYHPGYPTICSLSNTEEALKAPFEFQTPPWLCYCDAIEHVILHVKISDLRGGESTNKYSGLCQFLFPEIKMWFITKGKVVKGKWNEPAWNIIKNDEATFIEIYNDFYKKHPLAIKYSFAEYLQNQRKSR